MSVRPIDVIAAGHICLDVIPQLNARHRCAADLFTPGALFQVGPATLALGGSVANTGLALHRLGAKTRFVGKVGDDLLGKAILEALRQVDASSADNMIVAPGDPTSYSIVLSPPNVDRGFLHCPGTNDSFTAADLDTIPWHEARILHFGYPPLMRELLADEGRGLADIFAEVQQSGALVSLDMAAPNSDPTDWRQWLRNVLPHVDLFLPSLDEIQVMLDPFCDRTGNHGDRQTIGRMSAIDQSMLAELSNELHCLGAPIVIIKLGDQGLYLSTSERVTGLAERSAWKDFDWQIWRNRQLLAPCFDVEVVATTGSGDCTIAGFLVALFQGANPKDALRSAAAVGAYCVQSSDATSNIPAWSEIESRLQQPWPQRLPAAQWPEWQYGGKRGVFVGPNDLSSAATSAF